MLRFHDQVPPRIPAPHSNVGCTARALAHCHANGVRHLDIKPSNILLHAGRVYLVDFNVSRDVSGQDHTTTEALPGTERWRTPRTVWRVRRPACNSRTSTRSGLIYLDITTVLYNARLANFDDALRYSSRETREEQLRAGEEKLKKHRYNLVSHALVTLPFMFTNDGQETIWPRLLVNIITRMVSAPPQDRLAVRKLDDKLSMVGGIHQIYHGECCKRPISWAEDKWDRKFAAMVSRRAENDRQSRRG